MKKGIFILLFSAAYFTAYTQKTKYYTAQSGERLIDVIPNENMYEYSQFQQGVVNFKNGRRSSAKLNYHFVYEDIMFINADGDTLVISNPEEVKNVLIGSNQFFYSSGRYVRLDTTIGEVKLATAGFFSKVSERRIGAYGTTTDGGSASYSVYITPNNVKIDLTPNVVTTVAYGKAIFIGNRLNQFVPVTKANVFLFYAEKEEKLKQYLKEQKVNFLVYEDVVALVKYMNTVN